MKEKFTHEIKGPKQASPLKKGTAIDGPKKVNINTSPNKTQIQRACNLHSLSDISLPDRTSSETSLSDRMILSSETDSSSFSSTNLLKHSFSSSSSNDLSILVGYQISSLDIVLGTSLGQGASATVFRGAYRGEAVAIKSPKLSEQKISTGRLTQSEIDSESECLKHEKSMLERIAEVRANEKQAEGSQFIIQYYGTYTAKVSPGSKLSKTSLVIELANGGSLSDWIFDTSHQFELDVVHGIAGNIASGLGFLHKQVGILHCDLKPDNILIQKNENTGQLTAKICDFGISIEKHTEESNGTLSHLAPEIILGEAFHTEQSDMYSYGVVLWEITAKKRITIVLADENKIIEHAASGVPLQAPHNVPSKFASVMNRCLMFQPAERPSAKEVIKEFSEEPGF